MNDQTLLDNYLLILKSTVEVYVHGTLESSNDKIRNHLKKCLNNTLEMQANTYDKMVDFSWYDVCNISSDKITKTLQKINSK